MKFNSMRNTYFILVQDQHLSCFGKLNDEPETTALTLGG